MTETWKQITAYEGTYEVSNAGQVRSVDRAFTNKIGQARSLRGRVLSPSKTPGGYLQVVLSKESDPHPFAIHRLVLTAFVRPPRSGEQARHLDGNQLNNRVDNLAWGTASDNAWDKVRIGTHHYMVRDSCKWGHLLVPPNLNNVSSGRQCRACVLSRTAIRDARVRKGIALDHQTESDRRYAEIMDGR